MKKLFFAFCAVSLLSFVSCGNTKYTESAINVETTDSIKTDSITIYLQKMDSLNNSGSLRHLDVYKLGRIKQIEFQVVRITSETDTMEYINLRKDCGGEYFYDWVDSRLLVDEVKYFVMAIDTIANNFERSVDNEERYAYVTKDDIRLFSYNLNSNGSKWVAELSVDYRKKNSYINIGKDDLTALKDLLLKGEQIIKKIRK